MAARAVRLLILQQLAVLVILVMRVAAALALAPGGWGGSGFGLGPGEEGSVDLKPNSRRSGGRCGGCRLWLPRLLDGVQASHSLLLGLVDRRGRKVLEDLRLLQQEREAVLLARGLGW